jgi:photosystem II stability/assembly factor-like uncharacterized protein
MKGIYYISKAKENALPANSTHKIRLPKMKKIFLTALVFYSLFITHYSLCQWVWQNPMPSSASISKAFFYNANTGWVPSMYGRISKTTNGGLNWVDQSWQGNNINNLFFINENTGWAVGSSGLILKSTNGGTNWIQQVSGLNSDLNCVKFINPLTGWIGGAWNVFLRTTNGGINWVLNNQIGDDIRGISFVNSQTGWLSCSNGHIQKTTNGGITFQAKNVPSFYNNDIYFINENTGWFAGEGTNPYGGDGIYKTTDGGNNWIQYTASGNTCCYNSLCIKDINTGWVTTTTGAIYKTTNGGINWSNAMNPGGTRLYFVYFSDDNTGFTGGCAIPNYCGPAISKTTNGGLNWTSLIYGNNYSLRTVSAPSANTAFVTGVSNFIGRTTNGGNDWVYTNNNWGNLFSIYFVNEQTGWAAGWTSDGSYTTLIKTTNAGQSWINQDSTFFYGYLGLFFVNLNTGYAVGHNLIKKTTNSGNNWVKLTGYDTSNSYYSAYFQDAVTGWTAFGKYWYNGGILKTTNGGINWNLQFTSNNSAVKNLYFVNENIGYAVGEFSGILKTTNGGVNWYFANNGLSGITSMQFFDVNRGWFVGYSGNLGVIAKTTNGGINYEILPTRTNYILYCIRFADANTGWIAGENGVILKTTNGGNVFIKTVSSEIPNNFNLSQNYPNPFNPTTSIKYQVESSKHIKLVVYDILGKEIATLVNEKQSPGVYEVSWNASAFPSGIYFYKLTAGDFSETKKMLMIK